MGKQKVFAPKKKRNKRKFHNGSERRCVGTREAARKEIKHRDRCCKSLGKAGGRETFYPFQLKKGSSGVGFGKKGKGFVSGLREEGRPERKENRERRIPGGPTKKQKRRDHGGRRGDLGILRNEV